MWEVEACVDEGMAATLRRWLVWLLELTVNWWRQQFSASVRSSRDPGQRF